MAEDPADLGSAGSILARLHFGLFDGGNVISRVVAGEAGFLHDQSSVGGLCRHVVADAGGIVVTLKDRRRFAAELVELENSYEGKR